MLEDRGDAQDALHGASDNELVIRRGLELHDFPHSTRQKLPSVACAPHGRSIRILLPPREGYFSFSSFYRVFRVARR